MNDLVKQYTRDAKAMPGVAPKEVVPLTPQDKLKTLMSAGSWGLLQSFLAWGVIWEQMRAGEPVEYNSDSQNVMLSPFTFFGQSSATFVAVSTQIVPTLMYQIEQYRSDELYAKANPMPWLVLQVCGPLLSQFDFGPAGMRECMKVIAELKDIDTLPT